jgi:bifunctional DNA-binding transcriptional regulator/antitoxin component of YhaV-PrlF toxin-antitoxin module
MVIPAALRKQFGIEEGTLVLAEAHDGGVLFRPAIALPADEYRRQFLDEVNRGYAALRQDPDAWEAELAERATLDATLLDGFDPDELWTDDGDVVQMASVS